MFYLYVKLIHSNLAVGVSHLTISYLTSSFVKFYHH